MYGQSGSKGKGKGDRFGGYGRGPADRDDRDRRERGPPDRLPDRIERPGDRRGERREPPNDRRGRDARGHPDAPHAPHAGRGGGGGGGAGAAPPRGPDRRSGAAVPPPASVSGFAPEPTIHVSGCSNETVSNIIQGLYNTKESNHGKPVYKKEGPQGSVTVLIYYWDERDGPSFNGWWFGPKVGGDQVWAYNAGNLGRENAMPPTSNWKEPTPTCAASLLRWPVRQVPWDGKVDEKLRISVGAPRRGDPRDRERDLRDKREEEKRRREEEERRQREEARRRRQREEEQREQARDPGTRDNAGHAALCEPFAPFAAP
eukprot:s6486_g5.t1